MQKVTLETQFVVKGGLCKKACVLETVEIGTGGGPRHFCRVTKNDSWLLKCSAGREARKGVLKRSKVLENLKNKLGGKDSAVTESTSAPSDGAGDDPMTILDDIAEGSGEPSPKKPKYIRKRMRNRVHKIEMPIRPPECGGSAVAGHRQVSALARGTNQLWIAVEDVDWLINYVAAEVALGGVPEHQDDSDSEANCELEYLRMKYLFGDRAWKAEFVSGPLTGTTCTSSVDDMTAQKWATILDAVAVDFAGATLPQKKEGARLFLKKHCETVLAQHAV